MELFIASMAMIGLCTTIVTIDECIDWMWSFRREGEEDHQQRINKQSDYDIGYHE